MFPGRLGWQDYSGLCMNRADLNNLLKRMQDSLPAEFMVEIVEIEWLGSQRIFRIYLDCPTGVTHTQCASVSKWIDGEMVLDELFEAAYSLEVSSLGPDRPLRSLEHFRAQLGKGVNVTLTEPYAGKRKASGRIEGVDADGQSVTLRLGGAGHGPGEDGVWAFPLAMLGKARLQEEEPA